MATWVTPESTISANNCCNARALGVVLGAGRRSSRRRYSRVPTTPVIAPSARKIASIMKAVLVLPLVPVTPMSVSLSPG